MSEIKARFAQKHDVEANWNKATNFIPKAGEIIIYDKDSNYSYCLVILILVKVCIRHKVVVCEVISAINLF